MKRLCLFVLIATLGTAHADTGTGTNGTGSSGTGSSGTGSTGAGSNGTGTNGTGTRGAGAKAAADERYREGEQLYAAKQYLAAAAKFEDAYDLDPDPAILFNIAQAYRLGRACAQAARFYHRFLEKVPNPPERDKLDQYIKDMDDCARRESEATTPRVIHDTRIVHDTKVVEATDPGRRKRTTGLVVGAVGLVGLGVGAYFTYDVHQVQADRESVCATGCVWGDELATIQRLDQRGHRAEIIEGIVYASAGVALATGISLYLLGSHQRRERVSAMPLKDGGMAVLDVAF